MTDRDAIIILNMVSGIGAARYEALTGALGSPSAVLGGSAAELASVSGISPALARSILSWEKTVDFQKEMDIVSRGGVKIITRLDSDYPPILREIHDPPLCLYVRGNLPDLEHLSAAVVGSRMITPYGQRMAEFLSQAAVYAGWTVVSGLAFGIDAAAHRAVLDAGGKTVAVLGGGLARIHPQEHIPLARDIIESGAVISEFPMEFPVNRQSFPRRNRIVSGLCRATVVVEAGMSSGAMITAGLALEQGRQVFAVPGNADSPQSRGCNHLIRQGAKLTETFDDVIEEFKFLPGFQLVRENSDSYGPEKTPSPQITNLDPAEKTVFDALSKGSLDLEALIAKTSLPAGKLLANLKKLEFKKLVTRQDSGRYIISP